MVPFWTSFLIRTYAWVTISRARALLNSLLMGMGVIAEPLDLLLYVRRRDLGLVYTFLPFMILPIYSSVEKLDGALIEAALDLGAGPLRAFSRVIVPLTLARHRRRRAARVRAGARHLRRERHPGRRARRHDRQHHREPVQGNARNWPFGAALGTTAAGELRRGLLGGQSNASRRHGR
jgi:spermidine/putrescine transport system permease protein